MARLTQMMDYLEREADGFSIGFTEHNYTHFRITPKAKKVRRLVKYVIPNQKKFKK